jgi:hypothetical protein
MTIALFSLLAMTTTTTQIIMVMFYIISTGFAGVLLLGDDTNA